VEILITIGEDILGEENLTGQTIPGSERTGVSLHQFALADRGGCLQTRNIRRASLESQFEQPGRHRPGGNQNRRMTRLPKFGYLVDDRSESPAVETSGV
jgi:hypothetical protein